MRPISSHQVSILPCCVSSRSLGGLVLVGVWVPIGGSREDSGQGLDSGWGCSSEQLSPAQPHPQFPPSSCLRAKLSLPQPLPACASCPEQLAAPLLGPCFPPQDLCSCYSQPVTVVPSLCLPTASPHPPHDSGPSAKSAPKRSFLWLLRS